MNNISPDFVFNSPLETGIRSLSILTVEPSTRFDLQQLTAFDYLVVHSGGLKGGPVSLHPDTPNQAGELVIRRSLVEKGLLLMEYKNLVSKLSLDDGLFYEATELACVFIESLTNEYIRELTYRARWVVEKYGRDQALEDAFNFSLENWSKQFQFVEWPLNKREF